jgi:hypothetical protein
MALHRHWGKTAKLRGTEVTLLDTIGKGQDCLVTRTPGLSIGDHLGPWRRVPELYAASGRGLSIVVCPTFKDAFARAGETRKVCVFCFVFSRHNDRNDSWGLVRLSCLVPWDRKSAIAC